MHLGEDLGVPNEHESPGLVVEAGGGEASALRQIPDQFIGDGSRVEGSVSPPRLDGFSDLRRVPLLAPLQLGELFLKLP